MVHVLIGFTITLVVSLSAVGQQCAPGKEIRGEYLVRYDSHLNKKGALNLKAAPDIAAQLASRGLQFNFIHRQSDSAQVFSKVSKKAPQRFPSLLHLKNIALDEVASLAGLDGVLTVEPNCLVEINAVPNDPQFNSMWAHQVMESAKAWDISTGSSKVIVAVSDTGVDYTHPDLVNQMWKNQKEVNGKPGVDDDDNGCVDDIYGCDFGDDDGDPRPGSFAEASHGTHVAGIIGAVGNNGVGITGLNWSVQIMAIKGFRDGSSGASAADLLKTVYYAADNGAHVLNCSWGSNNSPSSADRDAFAYALDKNVIVVVAAGNSAANAQEFSPAGVRDIITVAASNSRDQLASFSNYGTLIDLMAPGGDAPQFNGLNETILSTVPGGMYEGQRGTSMAAPFVAGLAGLILSINPELNHRQVEEMMKATADSFSVRVPKDTNLNYTYKRINAHKAAQAAFDSLPKPEPDPIDLCLSGTNCRQSGGERGTKYSSVSEAVMDGYGGCEGRMKSRSHQPSSARSPFALFLLPLLGWLLLRRDD